jgi:hypothetical protein
MTGQNIHEMLYHKRAKFFYKWFINGGAVSLFKDVLNFDSERARDEASRFSQSVEAYCKGLYQEELRYGTFRKSITAFLDEPRVIAVNINYIARTFLADYPMYRHEFLRFMETNMFGSNGKPVRGLSGERTVRGRNETL